MTFLRSYTLSQSRPDQRLGAYGITALAAIGAPTAVLIGAGVLTVGAAGYGAYKVRQITESYFDRIN